MSLQDNFLLERISRLRRRRAPIAVGEQFKCIDSDRGVKTAKVLSIVEDFLGIPHVQYTVTIKAHCDTLLHEGPRLLALEAFFEAYSKRITTRGK
ncbi:MAG: hypothetical protein GKS00_11275 [Alphaproteobacteria bacterium]|nr:hypothetical protein [Alphaproteobacteria bacterium]